MSASAYTSFAFICRSCLASGYLGAQLPPETCLECGGGPLILHDELFDLSLAHIDCDAFYCSVEKRDNPDLHDQPVIVGGGGAVYAMTADVVGAVPAGLLRQSNDRNT